MARFAGTSKALGANEVYTSDVLNISGDDMIRGVIVADKPGTLKIQFSLNSRDWFDHEPDTAVGAGTPLKFGTLPYAPYMRYVFTNGSEAQGSFSLAIRVYDPQKGELATSRNFIRGGIRDADGNLLSRATAWLTVNADGSVTIDVEGAD